LILTQMCQTIILSTNYYPQIPKPSVLKVVKTFLSRPRPRTRLFFGPRGTSRPTL